MNRILDSIRSASPDKQDIKKILGALSERGFPVSASIAGAPGSEPFGNYLSKFSDYEKSPYVAEKRTHGQSIGRKHFLNSLQRAIKYRLSASEGKRLAEVSKAEVKKRSMNRVLSARGLTPNSGNLKSSPPSHVLTQVGWFSDGLALRSFLTFGEPDAATERFGSYSTTSCCEVGRTASSTQLQ